MQQNKNDCLGQIKETDVMNSIVDFSNQTFQDTD